MEGESGNDGWGVRMVGEGKREENAEGSECVKEV